MAHSSSLTMEAVCSSGMTESVRLTEDCILRLLQWKGVITARFCFPLRNLRTTPFLRRDPSWNVQKGQHFAVFGQRQVVIGGKTGGGVILPIPHHSPFHLVLPPLCSRVLAAICRRPVAKFGPHNEARSGKTTMQIVRYDLNETKPILRLLLLPFLFSNLPRCFF
jgi:hypothetical protein